MSRLPAFLVWITLGLLPAGCSEVGFTSLESPSVVPADTALPLIDAPDPPPVTPAEIPDDLPPTVVADEAPPEPDVDEGVLRLTPDPLDLGVTWMSCPLEGSFLLENTGTGPAVVSDIQFDDPAFQLDRQLPLPLTLQAGASAELTVVFGAGAPGAASAHLVVLSDVGAGVDRAEVVVVTNPSVEHAESFVSTAPPTDLMFIVDQSGSMYEFQNRLDSNFQFFINHLEDVTTNWRVIVANSDDGCRTSPILAAAVPGYANTFGQAVMSGGGYWLDDQEALLTPATRGIESAASGGCNAAWMRTNAMLHVVLVSDEREQSNQGWSHYVDRIVAAKGDASLVRVSAFIDPLWDNDLGYAEAVAATGGLNANIGSYDWTPYMTDLAAASVPHSRFQLGAVPDVSTLVVWHEGALVPPSQWVWRPDTNSIEVDDDALGLMDGDAIDVAYTEAPPCAP